jgi:hypothetical protein
MEGVDRQVLRTDVGPHLLGGPVGEGRDLPDHPVREVAADLRRRAACRRLVPSQAGDPATGAKERPPQRLDLAHLAAPETVLGGPVHEVHAALADHRLDLGRLGRDHVDVDVEPVSHALDQLVGLRVQATGVEGDHPGAADELREQVEDDDPLRREGRHERQALGSDAREGGHERRPGVHRLERLGDARHADAGEEREAGVVDPEGRRRGGHAGTPSAGSGAGAGAGRRWRIGAFA